MAEVPALIIPARGTPLTQEHLEAIERRVSAEVHLIEDFAQLEELRAQARALEHYLRDKNMQGPMLSAQRHMEARIGQLLGDSPGRGHSEMNHHSDSFHEQDRQNFRLLAHALNGECLVEFDEWRKSRRALISLIRQRLGLLPEAPPLPEGIFRCIVADPPWQVTTGPDAWGTKEAGNEALDYETMSIEQIKEMPIAERSADDAHLYLWTINKYVEQSYDVARCWGFKPSVLLVWAKQPRGIGLGGTFRQTCEFILYARRGSLQENTITETTWFSWPRGVHSRKPDAFYELVESKTPAPGGKQDRLELFARRQRAGWTVWGDEV